MKLVFSDGLMQGAGLPDVMREAGELLLHHEGVNHENIEVSVTFVNSDEIKELNRIYRGKDQVTDVLSFQQYSDVTEIPQEGEAILGDVVICPEQAFLQADEYGHSNERELVYLFVHSLCHLLGYDHMQDDEKALMRAAEERVMEKIGVLR